MDIPTIAQALADDLHVTARYEGRVVWVTDADGTYFALAVDTITDDEGTTWDVQPADLDDIVATAWA